MKLKIGEQTIEFGARVNYDPIAKHGLKFAYPVYRDGVLIGHVVKARRGRWALCATNEENEPDETIASAFILHGETHYENKRLAYFHLKRNPRWPSGGS